MRSGFRFDPPAVEVGPELRWVLWRAYGPAGEGLGGSSDLDPARALELAGLFALGARIGARTPRDVLEAEIGAEAAGRIHDEYAAAAALCLVVGQVCREVAAAGAGLAIPMIFIKGAALQLEGTVAPGSREMSDVDVLVPMDGLRPLQEALIAAGCRPLDAPESEHQLQLLTHRTGLGIELHRNIPGLRVAGGKAATAGDLIAGGLCRPAPGMPEGYFVPTREVTLAHVLVHGLAQHGMAPRAYPMSRMLADVQDLALSDEDWQRFLGAAFSWILEDVSREEAEAVAALARRLGAGEDPVTVARGNDPPARLLRHLVAGAMEERYVRAMRLRNLAAHPTDGSRAGWLARVGFHALFLTDTQIDLIYGKPRSALGYLGRRLLRPFDLVWRAVKYGWAWGMHRSHSGDRRSRERQN